MRDLYTVKIKDGKATLMSEIPENIKPKRFTSDGRPLPEESNYIDTASAFRNIQNHFLTQKGKAAKRMYLIWSLGVAGNMRISDLLTLTWKDFFDDSGNFKKSFILQGSERHSERVIYITKIMKVSINKYLNNTMPENLSQKLFYSQKVNNSAPKVFATRLSKQLGDASEFCGYKRVISYGLKKSFVAIYNQCKNCQCDNLSHISSLNDNKELTYYIVPEKALKEAYELVSNYLLS